MGCGVWRGQHALQTCSNQTNVFRIFSFSKGVSLHSEGPRLGYSLILTLPELYYNIMGLASHAVSIIPCVDFMHFTMGAGVDGGAYGNRQVTPTSAWY